MTPQTERHRTVVHPAAHHLVSNRKQLHLLCVITAMELDCSLPRAEGGKEWGIVTCEQAGNDPDSLGSVEQTRHYKSLSPTAILPLSHADLQYLSLSVCPPPCTSLLLFIFISPCMQTFKFIFWCWSRFGKHDIAWSAKYHLMHLCRRWLFKALKQNPKSEVNQCHAMLLYTASCLGQRMQTSPSTFTGRLLDSPTDCVKLTVRQTV